MDPNHRRGLGRVPIIAASIALLLLVGMSCVQIEPPESDAIIRGTLSYADATLSHENSNAVSDATVETSETPGGPSAAATRVLPLGAPVNAPFTLSAAARSAPFVPGEVIVKFTGLGTAAAEAGGPLSLMAGSQALTRARALSLDAMGLYRAAGTGREATLELVDALNARDDVLYAQPNYLFTPATQPSDELYPILWHYPTIGMEDAWELTTGSSDVVVAVIDTGMLMQHPDRPINLLGGYDFIDRDGDPTDPGPYDVTLYHGSHVIGTVAAAANNDYEGDAGADGIAGLNWRARILPVRALSATGTTADIVDAIVWSAGEAVPGVPSNSTPADVITMSFGGAESCFDNPAYQDAIDDATAAGSIPVAAAGNVNENAANFTPASCDGVITVGASTIEDERAFYSNWGPDIDLMAPGGDPNTDVNDDGEVDSVLSLWKNDATGAFDFDFQAGTSMAAAHVAGVISLMLDLDAGLDTSGVLAILSDTALPYSAARCDAGDPDLTLSGSDCGAGRIDAHAALQATGGADPAPPPPPPPPEPGALDFSPTVVSFGASSSFEDLLLTNAGSTTIDWRVLRFAQYPSNPADLGGVFTVDRDRGTLDGGESTSIEIELRRALIDTPGEYKVDFRFDTDGNLDDAEARLTLTFVIEADVGTDPTGPTIVCAQLAGSGAFSGDERSAGLIRNYVMTVQPGTHEVFGWADENANGIVDAGDFYGTYPTTVQVAPGADRRDVDFTLGLVQSNRTPAACFR